MDTDEAAMRLIPDRLTVPAIALVAGLAGLGLALAVLATAPGARAQGSRMDCFNNQGGRATCVESRDVLFDRLDERARETRAAASRDKKLARKVAEAIHEGRCADALVLAVKATDPNIPANTARLCGVPEADNGATPRS